MRPLKNWRNMSVVELKQHLVREQRALALEVATYRYHRARYDHERSAVREADPIFHRIMAAALVLSLPAGLIDNLRASLGIVLSVTITTALRMVWIGCWSAVRMRHLRALHARVVRRSCRIVPLQERLDKSA